MACQTLANQELLCCLKRPMKRNPTFVETVNGQRIQTIDSSHSVARDWTASPSTDHTTDSHDGGAERKSREKGSTTFVMRNSPNFHFAFVSSGVIVRNASDSTNSSRPMDWRILSVTVSH